MPSNQTQKKTKKIKLVKTPPPAPPTPPTPEDEEEEHHEQHNVGECECKDCTRIQAEMEEDEKEVCEECGSTHTSEDCDCVFCECCGDVNMTTLWNKMEEDAPEGTESIYPNMCEDCAKDDARVCQVCGEEFKEAPECLEQGWVTTKCQKCNPAGWGVGDDEPPCEKCGMRDEVEQCAECDAYRCIECDESEMATYGEGHDACTMCHECGVAYEANTFVQPYKGDAEPPKEELKHPAPATKCLTHDWKEEAKKLGYTIYFCADKKSKTFYHNQQRALGKIRKGQKTFKDYAHDWSIIKQEKAPGEPSKRARRAIEEVDKLRAEVAELRELVKQLLAK